MPSSTTAAALGLVVLLLVLAIPAAITVTDSPATATFDLDEGERASVVQTLSVVVEDTSQNSSTITLRDSKTIESQTETLSPGETESYQLNGDQMNVTLRELQGPSANATVAVEYPRTYGWAPGAKTMVDNLPLALVVVAFVVVIGGIGAATKR